MGFAGGNRGGGGFRGGGRGGFNNAGGGGRGGMKRPFQGGGFDQNKRGKFQMDLNPQNLVHVGNISHTCENKFVCKVTTELVPMFNSPVFLENKSHIGKSDEIFGQINNVLMSVETSDTIKPDSLEKKTAIYMDSSRLLPKDKFMPRDPPNPLAPKVKRPKQPGGGGNFRGGRGGGFRGGRGGGRGGNFGGGNRDFGAGGGRGGGFSGGRGRGGHFGGRGGNQGGDSGGPRRGSFGGRGR